MFLAILLVYSCASHTLSLIASVDIDLSKFDNLTLPKKNALRQSLAKMTAFWNKLGRSIAAAEQSQETFRKLKCIFRVYVV